MNTVQYCSCGDVADSEGTRCARCCALQALGLESSATGDEIKEAYRVLVKVWHPDRFQGDAKLRAAAEEKLKALNTAYKLLTGKSGKEARRQPVQPPRPPAPDSGPRVTPREPKTAGRRWRLMPSPTVLVGMGALACGVLIMALVLRSLDSTLASDPSVGRVYSELRNGMMGTFRQAAGAIWSGAEQRVSDLAPHGSGPAAAVSLRPADTAQPTSQSNIVAQTAHRRELGAAHAAPIKLMPYVTVGLTRDEVIAVEGAPTAATENKLVYQGSEIDFTAGKVSGWKIDPASSPIRVKLWPDAPVDPDLDSFGVGSSKNVVLVVQGTPTYFSENEFGYGGSVVYFQNGRVVSWKDDPAGAPLRTAPR